MHEYIFKNRVSKNGRYTTYFLIDKETGIIKNFSPTQIKSGIKEGIIIVHGLKMTSDGRLFVSYNQNNTSNTSLDSKNDVIKRQTTVSSMIDSWTGDKLREFIDNRLVGVLEQRDFVSDIEQYIKKYKKDNRVMGISGLRGVGKTIGVLQCIRNLNDYDNTIYLTILSNTDVSYSELYTYLIDNCEDKKYIFIDEITFVKNFIKESQSLYEHFCSRGKTVVISGTDSFSLSQSKGNGLYHRLFLKNVTFIGYAEAKRVVGVRNFNEYLELGGLFKADYITDTEKLTEYIDTAVVENISNTITKNEEVSSLLNLRCFRGEANKEKLRTLIYIILCAVVYSVSEREKTFSLNFIVNLFNDNEVYSKDEMKDLLGGTLGVDIDLPLNKNDFQPVLNALKQIGIVVKVDNIASHNFCNYYITNQSVFNQIVSLMIGKLNSYDLSLSPNATLKGKKGLLFESAIINHTLAKMNRYGTELYYYRVDGKEIDMVISYNDTNVDEKRCLLFEIKMTSDVDTAILKSRWINDSSLSFEGHVIDRYIIYSGKDNTTFTGFHSADLYPPHNMTLDEIESLNMGTKLLSVKDYLENIDKYCLMLTGRSS